MKSMQLVAHTTGGEIRSAIQQITEREYEALKEGLQQLVNPDTRHIEFDTEDGWVIIPGNQVLYIQVVLV